MKARVMIIEDSPVVRTFLESIIQRDTRLHTVAAVSSAEEALRVIDGVAPDVISLDIQLPGMNGLDATRHIMAKRPTPIVVVTASRGKENVSIAMRALEAGAVAVLEKPVGCTHDDYEIMAERLCTKLAIMSQVKVIRQHRSTPLQSNNSRVRPAPRETIPQKMTPLEKMPQARPAALGVASSTGGPSALAHLFTGLGAEFPLPILLVQHMTASFLPGFAAWLKSICGLRVVVLDKPQKPEPGTIYMACADRHLRWDDGCVRPADGSLVSSQRPSATVMFESLALQLGAGALGVILTGMGDDGAEGLLALRRRGGHTLAEDCSTAVVYGMPGEAVRIGAVSESLPITALAPRIWDILASRETP